MQDTVSQLSKVDWVVNVIKSGSLISSTYDDYVPARSEYDAKLLEMTPADPAAPPSDITEVTLGRTDFRVEARAQLVTITSAVREDPVPGGQLDSVMRTIWDLRAQRRDPLTDQEWASIKANRDRHASLGMIRSDAERMIRDGELDD